MPVALFIGNLDYATSEQELRDLFAQAGTVERVSIPTDRETGRVRGFGFVDMATIEEAHAAIQQFDGASLGGRTIRVNLAEERRSGRR